MPGGFAEWSTARTPDLFAFASALVDDQRRADAAVTQALSRVGRTWGRLRSDDPDLEARRLIVRACATPRRAAGVLRTLEDRSDAEIAAVLGCSASAARRHAERGSAAVARDWAGSPSVPGEDLVAGSASTRLLTRAPQVDGSHRPPLRNRAAWLAAAAVLALVCGLAYIAHTSRSPAGVISYPRVDAPAGWRYETYGDLQLQVPDTWGWGAAPMRASIFPGPRHLGACGTDQAAVLSPEDDATYVSTLTPYVGRPAKVSERCVPFGADGALPTAEAVWFDSPLPVGVKPVAGTVAETRAVGGQHVTVFAPQSSLRRQILGTVQQVDHIDANGCPRRAVARPTLGATARSDSEPASLSVCVYSQDTGVSTLLFSARHSAGTAQEYAATVAADAASGARGCPTPAGLWVALGLDGDGGTRWDVVNLACGRIELAGGRSASLSPATVKDWALGGVTAYVGVRHGGAALDDYFRAPTA